MAVSRPDRARLKQLLAQNGLSDVVLKMYPSKRVKRRLYKIAMSRDPANTCTPWAVRINSEDQAKIREAWVDRI